MLLPTIHTQFDKHVQVLCEVHGIPWSSESITSRQILSEICGTFQHHVTYACRVKKHGTLVFRPQCDFVALLSEALWNLQLERSREEKSNTTSVSTNTVEDRTTMEQVNSLVHDQINVHLEADAKTPTEYDELKLNELIPQIHPTLWSSLCTLTRSKSEIRGTSKVNDPSSMAAHIKRVRRYFLLCMILFCTDDRCSMPMHTLITDLVESQGGSSVLVRVLNRLGVCSSADTLARFIQHRVTSYAHRLEPLSTESFTVVSADNIDFMHSFAQVFCGNQKASWHGTTVQVVQPLPSLVLPQIAQTALVPHRIRHISSRSSHSADMIANCQSGSSHTPHSGECRESGVSHSANMAANCQTGSSHTPHSGECRESGVSHSAEMAANCQSGSSHTPHSGECRESGVSHSAEMAANCQSGSSHTPHSGECRESGVSHSADMAANCQSGSSHTPHSEECRESGFSHSADMATNCLGAHKRIERSSPFPSPLKTTKSPLSKKQRRVRTGTEGIQPLVQPQQPHTLESLPSKSIQCHFDNAALTLSHFQSSGTEKQAGMELQTETNAYMVHRTALYNSNFKSPFLSLQDYYFLIRATHTEQSNVVYLQVMDAVANCKDTMITLLHNLHETFIEGRNMQWLVVEGDAKLYDILQSLKFEYGHELSWLFPYPGDFHLLLNYQKALMKPYYDMGLKSMAQATGYPLPAIQNCSQFKRTHQFLMEAWESIYRAMILQYTKVSASHLLQEVIYRNGFVCANRELSNKIQHLSSIQQHTPTKVL